MRVKKYQQMIVNLDARVISLSHSLAKINEGDFSKEDVSPDKDSGAKNNRITSMKDVSRPSTSLEDDGAIGAFLQLVWEKNAAGVDFVPREQIPSIVVKHMESHSWHNPSLDVYGLNLGKHWYHLTSDGLLRSE